MLDRKMYTTDIIVRDELNAEVSGGACAFIVIFEEINVAEQSVRRRAALVDSTIFRERQRKEADYRSDWQPDRL